MYISQTLNMSIRNIGMFDFKDNLKAKIFTRTEVHYVYKIIVYNFA